MDAVSEPEPVTHLRNAIEVGPTLTVAGRTRSILIGSETLLVECAEILLRHGHDIVAVVAPPGVAADWARRKGLRHFALQRDLRDADLGGIDYLFSIANLSIVPADLLAMARRAAINFHDGPLPDYAGLNTPVWSLMAGETKSRRHLASDDRGGRLRRHSRP